MSRYPLTPKKPSDHKVSIASQLGVEPKGVHLHLEAFTRDGSATWLIRDIPDAMVIDLVAKINVMLENEAYCEPGGRDFTLEVNGFLSGSSAKEHFRDHLTPNET